MKKVLKISLISLLILLLIAFIYGYISFNYYSPRDGDIKADPKELKFYQSTYEECRREFISKSNEVKHEFHEVEVFSIPVLSRIDSDLKIDFCYIPAQMEKNKLLILSSGLHGVEGYVGSAIQQMFMEEFLEMEFMEDIGVLLIHGLNPYGFKYLRRVTENNVDLNRNCDINDTLFSIVNTSYTEFNEMVNPTDEVNSRSIGNKLFFITATKKIITTSKNRARQAVVQGQYRYQKGLFYGGNNFEPQIDSIKSIIRDKSEFYDNVFIIDFHTGFGERAKLHLFPNTIEDTATRNLMELIFRGYDIEWGDSEDFYTITGDFSQYIGKLIPEKSFLPMIIEYGTMNSQTIMGSFKSLHYLMLENQGYHFGYKSIDDEKIVVEDFTEMYYPSSEAWRSEIIKKTRELLFTVLKRYKELPIKKEEVKIVD